MKLALLGLGIIGSRVAARLSTNPAHQVRLWNRTPKHLDNEVATVADAVADADAVLLFIKDREATREVVARIVDAKASNLTLVNHASVDLETTQWLDTLCVNQGWSFLEAPFTGSREAAGKGALAYYVAGDGTLINRLEPLLLESATEIVRCGKVGSATIIKLATNLISACAVQALAEALATTTSYGISPEALINAVAKNANGSVLAAMKLPTMAEGDFDTHFSLKNMLKDSRYALELAQARDLDLPSIHTVSKRMADLCEQGRGDQDFSSLFAPYLKP